MDESGNDTDVDVLVHPEGAVHVLPTGIRRISNLQMGMRGWNLQGPVADFYHDKVGVSWSCLYSLFYERLSWKCGRYQYLDKGGMEFKSVDIPSTQSGHQLIPFSFVPVNRTLILSLLEIVLTRLKKAS